MYRILILGNAAFCRRIKASDTLMARSARIDCMKRFDLENALNSDITLYWDLLIADFEFLDESGLKLFQKLKNKKIYLASILANTELAAEKMNLSGYLGALDYPLSPFDESAFQAALQRCFSAVDAMERSNESSYLEQALIATVLSGDTKTLQIKLPLYHHQVFRCCNELPLSMETALRKISSQIYAEALKQHPWIKKFICDYGMFEKKFLCGSEREVSWVFESYLFLIADTIRDLLPLSNNSMIRKVCLYVLEHCDERISLSDTARHCFLNRTYLSHMFKAETDISFVDYISLVKMARAKLLFLEGRWKVFEISSMLGFSETGYFCKVFKKMLGVTPKQYKAMLKLSGPCSNLRETTRDSFGPGHCASASDTPGIHSA